MKKFRPLRLMFLSSSVLLLAFTQSAPGLSQTNRQLRIATEGSSVYKAIILTSSQATDSIETIRQRYATINKRAVRFKRVKKQLSGFSAEGGELVAYFDGSKLMKIVASHLGESGKAVEEYYYWDDRLIFVYRKDSIYDSPMSGKVARTEENRFYFDNDRLIRWIDAKAKQVASSDNEYQEKEKGYLKLSREFTDGARSKNSTIESAQ